LQTPAHRHESLNSAPEGKDRPRDIDSYQSWKFDGIEILCFARAPLVVDRIDAAGSDPYEHFAWPRHWIRALLELQHFRTAILVDNDRFHNSILGNANAEALG